MKLLTGKVTEPSVDEPEEQLISRWKQLKTPESFGEELPLKSLQKVIRRVVEKDAGKEDITIPFADMKFVDETGAIDIKGYGRVAVSQLAFMQLCTRLRIPADYMERCPLALRNSNLSYWVEQNDERKVLLRIRKFPTREQRQDGVGVLRAVLPQTYEPIDNNRIVDWVATALEAHGGALGIQSARIGETSTHIRLLFRDPSKLVMEDDEDQLFYGVHVSDSEVGERGFAVDLVTFRPAFETGFLHTVDGERLVMQRHIHIDFKLLRRNFAESFTAVKENVESVMEMWERAVATSIHDPHSYIRRLIRHHRMTNDFADSVITAFDAEPKPNKFGIALAMSRAALSLPIDMRVDTEALIGGYLLEGA